MHEQLLAQAAAPIPRVVLGMVMRDYSLGHELLLTREASPFVPAISSPAAATPADLVKAVLVCCQSYQESRDMWRDRFLGFKLALWKLRVRGWSFENERLAFVRYRREGMSCLPESRLHGIDGETRRQPGTPFLLRLHQFVSVTLQKGEAAAWDYPYGFAVMQWQGWHETADAYKVLNEDEAAHLAYVEEMENDPKRQEEEAALFRRLNPQLFKNAKTRRQRKLNPQPKKP